MQWRDILFYLLNKSRAAGTSSVSDRARGRAYKAAYDVLLKHVVPDEEITEVEVEQLPLTDHMKKKIIDLAKKSQLPPDAREAASAEAKLMMVPGIGLKKARELEEAGASSEQDLVRDPGLWNRIPISAQMFLTYRPLREIPRKVLLRLEPLFKKAAKNVGVSAAHVVGSFRRKMPFSKDADIMLVSPDPMAVPDYVRELRRLGLDPKVYEEGPDKSSMLLEYAKGKYLKADVFRTPPEEQYAMLLYATGSKDFNVAMRQKAASMGYLLNQKGLFRNGKLVPVDSEKGFFEKLGVPYIKPEDRSALEFRRRLRGTKPP